MTKKLYSLINPDTQLQATRQSVVNFIYRVAGSSTTTFVCGDIPNLISCFFSPMHNLTCFQKNIKIEIIIQPSATKPFIIHIWSKYCKLDVGHKFWEAQK
jgi:hypothetical protein